MDATAQDPSVVPTQPAAPEPTAPATEDRLLGSTFRPDAGTETSGGPGSAAVAVGLSAALEGVGQAYNRQPAKALLFLTAGLGLSTASGLNTWLARNLLGLKHARIGPERVRPSLLALWVVTYTLNLVDAWRTARRRPGSPST